MAGVRDPEKIVSVTCSRLMACEIAWRRSRPASPWNSGSHSGTVIVWMTAAGWLTERPSSSSSNVANADDGTFLMMSSWPPSRSLYAESSSV